ncbi:DUF4136 domain-containing protein [Pelagicoccus sp. SDUM812003]|uniref:DUF4136 domain-containing protein n=1 Tax=Pelagicoccus sp. SDUM812003 TaxID=3041267 RepID=UPI00280E4312|nr:DUF4136 domain-containing protein [Pelagicoccus sp. SDUM812003]MDQ8205505.1 DUF4136 domain-containing protein [Pelagicoccus sp. SDUM812003]
MKTLALAGFLSKTRLRGLAALAFLSLLLGGCATMPPPSVANVGYEFDSAYNFEQIRTFAIVRPESLSPMSPILRKNLLNEAASRLGRMGYQQVDSPEKADILVSIHGTSKQVIDSVTYSNVYYTNTYRRSSWVYIGGYPSTYITTREEGTLLMDIADARSKELVWRGWGTRRYTLESKVTDQQIYESIKRLMDNFPPSR